MKDYPESLTEVKIDLWPEIDERAERLRSYNNYNCDAVFDWDQFRADVDSLDSYRLSDDWYKKFGDVYWCGILNLEPWYLLTENPKYGMHEEETIWQAILDHHVAIEPGQIAFKFNPESSINGWLRTHSRDGDVATNVETLLWQAFKTALNLDSNRRNPSLWRFIEYMYCPKCELWNPPKGEWSSECWDCGSEMVYDPSEAEEVLA